MTTTRIEIPPRTTVTVVVAVGIIWLLERLWSQVLLFFIAILLAAAFEPVVDPLVGRGWSRGGAVGVLVAALSPW